MGINAIIRHMEETQQLQPSAPEENLEELFDEIPVPKLNDKQREYAERIFFEKELREINPGMKAEKVRDRIKLSIERAKMLYQEIYAS